MDVGIAVALVVLLVVWFRRRRLRAERLSLDGRTLYRGRRWRAIKGAWWDGIDEVGWFGDEEQEVEE